MNIKSTLGAVCLTTGALLSLSVPAHALVFSISSGTAVTNQGSYTKVTNATTIDFNSGSAPTSGAVSYSGGQVVAFSGGTYNLGYGPYNDKSYFLDTGGYYPNGKKPSKNFSDVTISFSTGVRYFGMYWGLINGSNEVRFYNANNQQIGTTITGNTLKARDSTIALNQSGANSSKYVDFFAGSNERISKVVLRDTSGNANGFETDNHAYRVVPFKLSSGLGLLVLGAWGVSIGAETQAEKQP